MLERLVGRFAGKRELRGGNELPLAGYYVSLSETDRIHVLNVVDFAKTLKSISLDGVGIAVIAVGSTVLPIDRRDHAPEDIDLRILNSAAVNSAERAGVVKRIQQAVKNYLISNNLKYDEHEVTFLHRQVLATSIDRGTHKQRDELISYDDYDNNDPSFVVKFRDGLPLHISISGVNSFDLDRHLRAEIKNNASFALLHKD